MKLLVQIGYFSLKYSINYSSSSLDSSFTSASDGELVVLYPADSCPVRGRLLNFRVLVHCSRESGVVVGPFYLYWSDTTFFKQGTSIRPSNSASVWGLLLRLPVHFCYSPSPLLPSGQDTSSRVDRIQVLMSLFVLCFITFSLVYWLPTQESLAPIPLVVFRTISPPAILFCITHIHGNREESRE